MTGTTRPAKNPKPIRTGDKPKSSTRPDEALLIDSSPLEGDEAPDDDELSFNDDDSDDVGVDFVEEDEPAEEVAP